MKRRNPVTKRILHKCISSMIILILLIPTLSACAKSDAGADTNTGNITANTPNLTKTTEIYYREEPIPIPDDFIPSAVNFLGREVYMFDGQNVLVTDQSGKFLREIKLTENEFFPIMDLQADRSFWCVSMTYVDGKTVTSEALLEKIDFVHFSKEGAELSRISTKGDDFGENEAQMYFRSLIIDDDYFYLMSFQAVYIIDKSGNLVMELRAGGSNLKDSAIFSSLFWLVDGRIAAASNVYGDSLMNLIQIPDPKTDETEEFLIPAARTNNIITTGKQADILLCTDNGFFDFDLKTSEQSLIFDNLKYGVSLSNLANVTALSDSSIAIIETSPTGEINYLARFVPYVPSAEASGDSADATVDYSKATDKQTLTLAAVRTVTGWELHKAVAGFNRSNKDYHVEVKDYSMNNLIPFEEALMKFNLDLISGNPPDIIMLSSGISSDIYVSKGILMDLNEFIENDPDFNEDDYLPNVFEALELDGSLYEIFPMFYLDIIMAKTADVGTEIGWTLDEFDAFIATKPDAQYALIFYSKSDFIIKMIRNQFVNPFTGETHFDRDEFKKILAVAERLSDTGAKDVPTTELLKGLSNGDPLMYALRLFGFDSLKQEEYLYFREETTIKGWPSPVGNGLRFLSREFLSITAQGENPDGAWEFIKYTLDNAEGSHGSNFPIKLDLLEVLAKERQAIINDPNTEISNGVDTVRPSESGFSDADIDKIMEAVKATKLVERRNTVIETIIMEEVDSYLSGQKSADIVADIIENRIGIYLAEQK